MKILSMSKLQFLHMIPTHDLLTKLHIDKIIPFHLYFLDIFFSDIFC